MSERFRYQPPITEPNTPEPILEPNIYPTEQAEFSITRKQRLAILERDGNKCQATVPHYHDENHPLEVDHIIPQRYAQVVGLPNPDIPENLLSKCRNAHDLKHKDRISAREEWRRSKTDTFESMFRERNKLLEHGTIYWDPSYDRTDIVQALKLTQLAQESGWQFPKKQLRNKH